MDVDHYQRVAAVYDAQIKPYLSTVTSCVLRHLPINQEDVIVDIGAGTGKIAHHIWKQLQLKNHILCVDPSKEMVDVAGKKDGLKTLQATAEEFFSHKFHHVPFNKILMCGCMYLFQDPMSIFTDLKERLPVDGACIVTYTTKISPLPKEIWLYFDQRNQQIQDDTKIFDEVGLRWKFVEIAGKMSLPKSDWFNTLRSRGFLSLNRYTDEQLEEEVVKMEEKYRDDEMLDIEVEIKAVILTK